MRKGQATREKLMDIAEAAVLSKGFGATSIEEVIAEAEITKSGFFYHFKDKNELARALLERHIRNDDTILDGVFERARQLHDDPLHAFLIGLKLPSELLDDMPNGHPGCLVATYCYNERLFDQDVRDLNRQAVVRWRMRFLKVIEEIAAIYPPRLDVNLTDVADMVSNTVEGGIIMSKTLKEPRVLGAQILLLHSYMKLLFLTPQN